MSSAPSKTTSELSGSAGQRLNKFASVSIFGLMFASTIVLAQGGKPQFGSYDPVPDAHRPPSADELDRMAPAGAPNRPSGPSGSAQDAACLLPPLTLMSSPSVSAEQLRIPARARNEYRKACTALAKNRGIEAEKHLRKAVSRSSKYAAAWVTLGQVLTAQRRVDEARRACAQGSTADGTYVPAYLCLADIAARERAWDEVLKFSGRAIDLDPANNAVAYEYRAAASLNLNELSAAEESGLRAVEIDKDHHEPRVHFVLAQIYEAKGDLVNEALQLREYLRYASNPSDISVIKQALSELQNQPVRGKASERLRGLAESAESHPARWAPPEIDERIPPIISGENCPLAQILKETSDRTQDLIDNLQRFSANERIEQTDIDKNGQRRTTNPQESSYVAEITQNSSGYPTVNEYRSRNGEIRRSAVIDSGTAAFALIFHPTHLENFEFRCEGLTELRGFDAWQLRFEESADRSKSFTSIRANGSVYLPRFKGRAWIATSNYEVLRIETDLVSVIPEIDLQLEHMVIDYSPVEFQKRHVQLWLPQRTSLYLAYRGHRYERTHNFNQFQLFSVDSAESIKVPLVGKDAPSQ